MGGGTEAYPDLGEHCQHPDCNLLDFLPFTCDGCKKVFCLEHRSFKTHECPKSDEKSRVVFVCEICSTAIEITGFDKKVVESMKQKHEKSGHCDPKKKKKPRCPVGRCRETLTFSNRSTCKTCQLTVCLKHRFPAEHACKRDSTAVAVAAKAAVSGERWNDKFLVALGLRNGKDCLKSDKGSSSKNTNPSVKAY